MQQRDLGKTGLRVSALGFGTGAIGGLFVRGDLAEQRRAVARALEAGITYFDTAPSYGDGRSEENLGRVLHDLGAWGRVAVGTKVRLAPADVRDAGAAIVRSSKASLTRLGRDAVDLLQLHNPVTRGDTAGPPAAASGSVVDLATVLESVAEGMHQVVRQGLARHAGLTGLGDALALRAVVAEAGFETVQAYFNAANPSAGYPGASGGAQDFDGLIDHAAAGGMGVIAIRVMAAGALSGTPDRHANAGGPGTPLVSGGEYAGDLTRARAIGALAKEVGADGPLELALRFVLAKPGVSTALVGYSDLTQLEDAIRWTARGPLPEHVVGRILDVARTGTRPGARPSADS